MQIHSVGIDLGKTTFHLVALGTAGKALARKKFTQKPVVGLHCEHAFSAGRCAAGARCPVDSNPACEAPS
jgi:hypothetical protein